MCKFCEKELEDGLKVNDSKISLGVLGNMYLDCTWFESDDPEGPYKFTAAVFTESKECSSYTLKIKFCPFCGRDLREPK